MAITKEIEGTLKMYQGDTGGFSYENVPTDKNYFVFCQIRNRNGDPVGNQLMVESNYSNIVDFFIDDTLSDLLVVPFGRSFEPYSYSIKICDANTYSEDTVNLLGIYGQPCRIIVYQKQAEGFGVIGNPGGIGKLPPNPCPPVRPIAYQDHKPQEYNYKRMVTREELVEKLKTKVNQSEFETLSADVVLLAQRLSTHIEEEDVIIEQKVTSKIDEVIHEKDFVTQDDLDELDNKYLRFEEVENVAELDENGGN